MNENTLVNPNIPPRSRQDDLKAWLAEQGLSLPELGRRLGVSAQGVFYMLKSNTIHPYRHDQLKGLGIPEELLPEPALPRFGPRGPRCVGCDDVLGEESEVVV